MTTIAIRHGIVAADTGATSMGTRGGCCSKIVRHSTTGDVAGGTGWAAWVAAFHRWCLSGEIGESPKIETVNNQPTGKGFIARANGEIHIFETSGWWSIRAPYYATGSGQDVAIGCMWHGGDAVQAVRAAIEHDEGTYGEIEVLKIGL